MTDEAKDLLQRVLQLPVSDRAELVVDVLASLDGEPEADVQAAWASEAEGRLDRYLRGEDQAKDWGPLRSQIEHELGR